jgi:hypothetical protein
MVRRIGLTNILALLAAKLGSGKLIQFYYINRFKWDSLKIGLKTVKNP